MAPKPDAIEKDVSTEEQTQLVKDARDNANGQRLDAVQELAQNARDRRDADLEEAGHDVIDTSIDPNKVDDELDEAAIAAAAAEEEAEKAKLEKQEKEETRILKVNGEDIEVPVSKILDAGTRTLQKESAADARLEEATRLLKEAEAHAATQLSTDTGSKTNDEMSKPSIDAENLAKTLIDGDLEEVTDVVNKILGEGRGKEIVATQDRGEIFNLVQDALNVDKALALFQQDPEKGGFNDLYKNEMLRGLVMDEEKKLADSGDTRDYSVRLADAAKTVREIRDDMIKESGATVADFEKRKEKKSKAENTIEGSGGREQAKGDLKPKTREQVRSAALEKMADSRGQQID